MLPHPRSGAIQSTALRVTQEDGRYSAHLGFDPRSWRNSRALLRAPSRSRPCAEGFGNASVCSTAVARDGESSSASGITSASFLDSSLAARAVCSVSPSPAKGETIARQPALQDIAHGIVSGLGNGHSGRGEEPGEVGAEHLNDQSVARSRIGCVRQLRFPARPRDHAPLATCLPARPGGRIADSHQVRPGGPAAR